MTVVPTSEYMDLIDRAQKNKATKASEVKEELDKQVEKLNSELKHRVEMEQLKHTAEIQILKAKLSLLETASHPSTEAVTVENVQE